MTFFRPLGPWDFLYITEETQSELDPYFDQYGDSYKIHATKDSLAFSIQKAKEEGQKLLCTEEMTDFEFEYGRLKYGLFRSIKATFYDGLDLSLWTFRYYGGQVCDICDSEYFIVPEDIDKTEIEVLKSQRRKSKSAYKIVTEDWIDACVDDNQLISDLAYML